MQISKGRIIFSVRPGRRRKGVVYGTLLGLLITYIFVQISLPEQTGWTVVYVFPTTGVVLSFVAAFLISAIGSILPMREISRFPIAKLIRDEP